MPLWRLIGACLLLICVTPVFAQQSPGTLKRIQEEGVLRWGADPSGGEPFAFPDPKDPDRIIGFEVEIVEKIAQHLGVKPQLVVGDWQTLVPSLEAKRIDFVFNGLELKPGSADRVRYTVLYFQFVQQLTIRTADRDKYHGLDDLKGRPIAVLNGSASVEVLKKAGWTQNLIEELDDSIKPYAVLRDKRVDAVLAESIIAKRYAGDDPHMLNLPDTFAPGFYVGAVRKEDGDLLKEINHALETMKQNGELADIYQKWGIYNERQGQIGVFKSVKGRDEDTERTLDWGNIALSLLEGTENTLLLTAISMPLALLFGLILALMARSENWLLAWPAQAYIQVTRGTPFLVQIYVVYFTLPMIGQLLGTSLLTWPAFLVGVLCLSANYAAYEAEIHRAGLDAVPRGQREAALSLGMSEQKAFFHVILPQSFRIILPPVMNDLIAMLKDSSMVSAIGVMDLLRVADSTGKSTLMHAQFLFLAAVIYLILSLGADFLGKRLEHYLKQRGTPLVAKPGHH